MEDKAKQIHMERMQANVVPEESPAKKASIFCFKKRKKPREKMAEKDEDCESPSLKPVNQDCNLGGSEADISNSLWASGGAWLAFKRLVTLRRRAKPPLKKHIQGSSGEMEMEVEDLATLHAPKERTSLKMPCLRFSRSRKRPTHPEITEELGEKVGETASILLKKSASEPETMGLEGPLSTEQFPSRVLEEREGGSGILKNIDHGEVSVGEHSFAIESRPSPDCYTNSVVQSEIIHSEKVLETEQERQIFQLHQGSLYGDPEEGETKRFDFKVDIGPPLPQDLLGMEERVLGKDAKCSQATEVELGSLEKAGDFAEDRISGKDCNSVEVILHGIPSALEDNLSISSNEEVKHEESKPALPGMGIVITITEAEDIQEEEEEEEEEEVAQICEPFSFSQASKQKGKKKANKNTDSGMSSKVPSPLGSSSQEPRTSEQYEVLLIETAASLVKGAIQSSVEQLLNEMALEQNKQNSFL